MSEESMTACDVCSGQFAPDDLQSLNEKRVCPACMDVLLQQRREGSEDMGEALENYQLALYQRRAILALLLNIMLNIGIFIILPILNDSGLPSALISVLSIGLLLLSLVNTIILAVYTFLMVKKISHWLVGVLAILLFIIPLLGILFLAVMSGKVTKKLKDRGIKVGFLGVSKRTLQDLKEISGNTLVLNSIAVT